MKLRKLNQQNPPKNNVDKKGNVKKRIFVKSGTATMLLVSGMTDNACVVFIDTLLKNIEKLGGKLECKLNVIR